MGSRNGIVLGLAEGLLDLLASSGPELSGPHDVNDDPHSCTPEEAHAVISGVNPSDVFRVGSYLLAQEVAAERELLETGKLIDVTFRHGVVCSSNDGEHVLCRVGAVVDQEDGRTLVVELDAPVADGLVGCDGQRLLTDRVRIATYLVRLGCKAVCRLGDREGLVGNPVGFLREAIRLLRELVGCMRVVQGDDGRDASQDPCCHSDASDDDGYPLREVHVLSPQSIRKRPVRAGRSLSKWLASADTGTSRS